MADILEETTVNTNLLSGVVPSVFPTPSLEQTPLSPIIKKNRKLLEKMKNKVYEIRPTLREIIEKKGDWTLFQLSSSYNDDFSDETIPSTNNPYYPEQQLTKKAKQKILNTRKKEFLSAVKNRTQKLWGKETAKSVYKQLKKYYSVSTNIHQSPITHPGVITHNLLVSLPYSPSIDIDNIISLVCANISFDNFSFPRGLMFHSFANNQILNNQLVFFGRTVDSKPVINHKPYTQESITNIKKRLQELLNEGSITTQSFEKLNSVIDEIYADPKVLECKSYSDQLNLTNYMLWKKITEGKTPKPTNLISLEQEAVISDLLLKHHIHSNTVISKILFDEKYHKSITKNFNGIMGAFNTKKKTGTFLFWGHPKGEKYRVQLWKKGNFLQTSDGKFKVKLTPQAIHKGLEEKELIPNTLLFFTTLSFYYGVKVIGSHNQTTYLTQMKEAFFKVLKQFKDLENIQLLKDVKTKEFSYARPILAFVETPSGELVPATALDLLLYGHDKTLEIIHSSANHITVDEALSRILPYLYKAYYPKELQEEKLVNLTPEQIEAVTGLIYKIKPCVSIS